MRFGRRNKNKPISVRPDEGDLPEGSLGPVASDERSELLSYDTPPPGPTSRSRDANSIGGGDPTQQLGTALGRFHRYVMKGQAKAPQEYWSDDCMNQLAAAIEIALAQGWMHLVESLTDVARILQSYENANAAHLCVPFLIESYEMLSLMVGDLMVNNSGSGIIDQWRDRYRAAVQDLAAEGLSLVVDDDREELGPRASADRASEIIPFERPREVIPERMEEEPAETKPDTFLPFLEVHDDAADEEPEAGVEEPLPVEEPPAPLEDTVVFAREETPEPVRTEEAEATDLLDSLCDELALLDRLGGAERTPRLFAVIDKVSLLETRARERELELPQRVCRRMKEICTAAAKNDDAPLDRFLDTAYAFCEAYIEASKDPDSDMAETWMSGAATLLRPPEVAIPAKVPEIAAEAEEVELDENASPQSLLEVAQQAVVRGDVSGAKALALQAVAHMARLEAEKAEARVREAETRLREGAEAIDRARSAVKKAEQEVVVAESRVTEGEMELTSVRERVTKSMERMGAIERRLAEIDEEIRALVVARENEDAQLSGANSDLARQREAEVQAEADLSSIQEAEEVARMRLENARQQVKDLQRRRSELEAALARNREALTRNRSSLSDIERTVFQLHSADGPAPQEQQQQEELLF